MKMKHLSSYFLLCLVCIGAVQGRTASTSALPQTFQGVKQRASSSDSVKRVFKDSKDTLPIVTSPSIAAANHVTSPTKSTELQGLLTILGGFLTHLTLGTLYCWGNFGSYAPRSLRFFDGKDREGTPDSMLVIPMTLVSMCLTMPVGSILTGKLGSRLTMMLGSLILVAGVYLSSYVKSLAAFLALYSVMGGAGIGLAYTAPMMAGWKWMPASKGFVSGAVLTGFGAGGFFFNIIGSKLVNPKGLNPVKGRFPAEVYNNFSPMLRNLAGLYSVVALVGSLLVTEPAKPTSDANGGKATVNKAPAAVVPGMGIVEALKTPQFWLLWTMIICSASAGLNVASVYKQFATSAPALAGDEFQSLVGGMGALFNGIGRLFWGSFSDKVGFKKAFGLLTVMQGVLHFLYPFSSHSKETFLAATCLCFFYLAGNFALMPPAIQRMYGPKNGALIYGIVYSAFAIASTGGLYLSKALLDQFGYVGIFRVMAVCSLFATALTFGLKPIANVPYSTV